MDQSKRKHCDFSCTDKMCLTLDKAGVPRENKWRSLVMYMRSLNHHDYLSRPQRSEIQQLLIRLMNEKSYTDEKFTQIMKRNNQIFSAPYVEKIKLTVEESQKLLGEFQSILKKRRGSICDLETNSAQALADGKDPSEVLALIRHSFKDLVAIMDEDVDRLDRLCRLDPLTELYNRRAFDEFLQQSIQQTCKDGKPVALIFIDIDHFKKFNDQYGHRVGDQALKTLAKLITQCVELYSNKKHQKQQPFAARYGGEEFTIVLPSMTADDAYLFAEQIRNTVAGYNFLIRNRHGNVVKKQVNFTVSLGVADLMAYQASANATGALIENADYALYVAKSLGRNCTHIYQNDGMPLEHEYLN